MRIVHFSDVHIGVENFSRIDLESGLSTRLLDFLETLDEVVDYCIENEVSLALFCGDAYKSRDPSQTHQREFAKRISRMSEAGISTFLVEGNHDIPAVAARATALDIFRTLKVENVTVGNKLEIYVLRTRSGPIQIVSIPWVRRSGFLTREETRGLTPEAVNELIQQRLTAILTNRVARLDPDIPAIVAGHLTVSEATTSSEQSMMLGRDYLMLKSSLAIPQLDYVALGHIHRHQVLGERPHMVYSGALQRIDFGEETDEKGFCVIELDTSRTQGERMKSFEFVPVNARRLLTIAIDIPDGDSDPTTTVMDEIAKHEIAEAVVRLRVSISSRDESRLSDRPIREALSNAHFIAAISRETRHESKPRLGTAYDPSTGPREALKLYLNAAEIPDDRAKVLMEYAASLVDDSEPNGLQ